MSTQGDPPPSQGGPPPSQPINDANAGNNPTSTGSNGNCGTQGNTNSGGGPQGKTSDRDLNKIVFVYSKAILSRRSSPLRGELLLDYNGIDVTRRLGV